MRAIVLALCERVCCSLVLKSVTSTPQWIRHPEPRVCKAVGIVGRKGRSGEGGGGGLFVFNDTIE